MARNNSAKKKKKSKNCFSGKIAAIWGAFSLGVPFQLRLRNSTCSSGALGPLNTSLTSSVHRYLNQPMFSIKAQVPTEPVFPGLPLVLLEFSS